MREIQTILKSEIEEFRAWGHSFINGEISRADFKGKSGGMGVYSQRSGTEFMIRLRTPSGVITREHLNLIYGYAQKYNLEKVHITTRQAVQLHDLSIDAVCDIMDDAIDHKLFTRGGGGNFPRNVALSPLSGVEVLEAFDVTPFALMVGDYLLNQVTSYKLPRKLKIAFSNGSSDSANATLNDMGFLAVIQDGKPYFEMYLAGGLGNNPATALKYSRLVEPAEVLYHVEAITQLFIAEGDYENKAKARIRYIPRRMGVEEFLECYEKHLEKIKNEFNLVSLSAQLVSEENNITDLSNTCLIHQKQNNFFTVVIHPLCGQLLVEDLGNIVKFINKIEVAQVRIGMDEAMYIRNLTKDQANELLDITKDIRCVLPIEQSITCIGVPTCQVGIEQSQQLLTNILGYLKEKNAPMEYLSPIHISGCGNSCSRHQVGALGFAGRKVKVEDVHMDAFDLYAGGEVGRGITCLGEKIGTMIVDVIPKFLCELSIESEIREVNTRQFIKEYRKDFDLLIAQYTV